MLEYTLTLPLLTGTHKDAQRLIDAAALPTNLRNAEVHVDASSALAGTDSFVDELVRTLLLSRSAAHLIVNNVGTRLGHQFYAAAKRHEVTEQLLIHFSLFNPHPDPPVDS